MLRFIYPALRWTGRLAVLLYVVTALVILGAKHVLLPNIDNYKPYLEAQLSALLDSQVEIAEVAAQWQGLNPRVDMTQIKVQDGQGDQVLAIPQLTVVVSWRSVLRVSPQFVSVHATGVDLSVRRDPQKRLWLLGREVDHASSVNTQAELGSTAVNWLVSQPQIRLYESTIRWRDESRSGASLVLQEVNLKIRNREQQHQFSLTARPAASLGGTFDMRGNFSRAAGQERPLALETGSGQLYFHIDNMRPEAWMPWVDWPTNLHSERVSTQAWLTLDEGQVQDVTADVKARKAMWRLAGQQSVHAGTTHFYIHGRWENYQNLLFPAAGRLSDNTPKVLEDANANGLDFSVQAQDLWLSLPDHYEQPVHVRTFSATGTAARQQGVLTLHTHDLSLQNKDFDVTGKLSWIRSSEFDSGRTDTHLTVRRADLSAVHRYMPVWLDDNVRHWLKLGLLAGQAGNLSVVLQGDLSQFPFDKPGSDGLFRIQGDYRDAIIDYAPKDKNVVGWPRLEAVQGRIDLYRASLNVYADTAQIMPKDGAPIHLVDIDARIADLTQDSVLEVNGNTYSDGAAYLAFVHHSPVDAMLNHFFDRSQGQGAWRLPLELIIPLAHPDDTVVKGTLQIEDGRLQIDPEWPAFEAVSGQISFTQDVVVAESLSARFLSEPVTVSGGVGLDQPGLRMAGKVGADRLAALFDVPGMKRFAGKTAYQAILTGVGQQRSKQSVTLDIESDLKGMAFDFPPPLKKTADQTWPLHLTWSYGSEPGSRSLAVTLNHTMVGRFEHNEKQASKSYFHTGSIAVGLPAKPSETGLSIDISYPVFDGDAWKAIIQEFDGSSNNTVTPPLLPKVHALRLQSERGRLMGLPLDALTYTIKQTSSGEWRVDVSSTQTAGTLTWSEVDARVEGPVKGVFHRLSYGDVDADDERAARAAVQSTAPDRTLTDALSIPAINLIIDNLSVYGRSVGKLALVGVNEDRGDTWRLEQFTLSSPSAHLEGRGVWRLRGQNRGLSLDASVDVSDLGEYLDQIGFVDILSGGHGTVQGRVDWQNVPWSFDKNNINGRISFEFLKGRLSTINSKSARLLELLSLQSIARLATLDLNPATLTRDGFPYDMWRGVLKLKDGKMQSEDYRISGPVGTVVLEGLVYLSSGKLDLQAVVVPNLDVSGAAIAAGVAINPVVGIGAFLTQWFLKAPLAAAMTAQYRISGDWDAPEIVAVERLKGSVQGQTDP